MYYSTNLRSKAVHAAQYASYWLNTTITIPASFYTRSKHTLLVKGENFLLYVAI